MIKLKLNVFFRNIKKSKLTFFINFIGLTSGITCALLIFLWVKDELNVDKFHTNDNELYQVKRKHSFDDAINVYDDSSVLLADVLKEEMPEVKSVVRIGAPIGKNTLSVSDKAVKSAGLYADKDFFNVFGFKMLEGDKNNASNVFLICVEALNEANSRPNHAAYDAINEVRDCAGLDPLSDLEQNSFRESVNLDRRLKHLLKVKDGLI